MRLAAVLVALFFVALTPLAAASTVTKSCTLGTSAIVSIGTCSVTAFANNGLRVTITVYASTHGNVHVDMSNANGEPNNIEWECPLTGSAHSCVRIVDTGGPNGGVWTVTGYYAGVDLLGAPATMSVDFLTF